MKRLFSIIGCILLVSSCARKEQLDNTYTPEGKQVTIRVSVPESPFSKVSFTAEENKLKLAWEDGDCLRVISGDKSEVFTISNIISDHEAEFTGPEVSGTSFDILFPGTYSSIEAAQADLVSPTQTGNASTAHLKYRALLSGVDTYNEIQFKPDWATAHGGSLKQAPAVKLQVTLPPGVANVKKAGLLLGGENYTVPLSGVNVSESSQTLTAYLMLPWEDIPLESGTKIPVYVMDADNEAYGTTLTISGEGKAILQGKLNTLSNLSLTLQDFVAGDGSAGNPYLIANARQLNNMHNVMVNNSSNCFRLLEDIDAASIANWVPLNTASGFSKAMDFDGDAHTVSNLKSSGATYSSFSGVLNGHIYDVTFDKATVSHTSKIGVVGGFIGTTGIVGNCTDVHVTNSSVSGSTSWGGGFAAEINTTGTLLRCSVENTDVTAAAHVGEFAGIVRGQVATLSYCYTKNVDLSCGTVPSNIKGLGGFIGCATVNAKFDHCHVEGPVTLTSTATHDKTNKIAVGGFIGYLTPGGVPTFNDCYVEGSDITLSGNSEVGGFVGNSDKSAAYTRCRVSGVAVSGTNYLGGFLGLGQVSGGYEVPAIFTECQVENVTVTQNCASASGSIHTGGFAGTTAQALSFIDCSVSGTVVSAMKAAVQNVGGFIGCTTGSGANFQGCTVDNTTSVEGQANSVGGFVGWAYVPDAYKNCSSAASVSNTGSNTGGFVGHATASSAYTGCSAAGNVTSSGAHTGGFVGLCESSSYFECHYDGGIVKRTGSAGSNNRVGGFVGSAASSINFSGCYVSNATIAASTSGRIGGFAGQLGGNSTGGDNVFTNQCYVKDTGVDGAINTGGFVGVQYADIAKSYVEGGSVTAHGNQTGGFSAFIQNGNIADCYTTAAVNGGSYADVGGFAAHIYDNSSIRNSYSSGTQSGSGNNRSAFVAVCQRASAAISNCIGWHATLPFCKTNTAGAAITNGYAGTQGTVSAQAAAQQGWSTDVWNLNGPLPLLKPGSSRIPAVFIGDSITWQWARVSRTDAQSTIVNATHGVLGNTPLPSYMSLSGSNITTKFHPEFFSCNGYIDKGISGQNTTQMRARFQKDVIALNPEVFVIMGGTNDIAQGYSEDYIFDNVAYMASEAKAAGIKAVICSITPNNRDYGGTVGWKSVHIEELNSRYKALCDSEGYAYCDYWSSLVARNSGEAAVSTDIDHGLKDGYKLYDDLHPGPDAYTVMEGIIKPIIDGLSK